MSEDGSVPNPVPPSPSDSPTASGTVAAPPSRRPRDLVLSLVVLLVPIAVLMGIYQLVQGGDEPVVVDVTPVIAQARAADDFPVAVPDGLGDGWRSLRGQYEAGDGEAVLRIGYLSPSGAGFQLVESDRPADALLAEELTDAARPLGVRRIAGRDWQEYEGRPGERALVLLERERTLLVVGAGSDTELTALASSLPAA